VERFKFRIGIYKYQRYFGLAQFNVYIDESGDVGIGKVRQGNSLGASPYFVLGAVVCQPTAEVHVKNAVMEFKKQIGKSSWKHATDLGHAEKVLLSRELGRLPVRFFGLVSNKATLAEYKNEINSNPQKFYNKCVKYLLESVCSYLSTKISSDEDLRVVLEKRNHDYDAMLRYLNAVRENPLYEQSKSLKLLNPFGISTMEKGESEMLEVADFVAHAIFQCVNRSKHNYEIPEPRYFREISSRFAGSAKGDVLGVGLKCLHSLEDVRLDHDVETLFSIHSLEQTRRLPVGPALA